MIGIHTGMVSLVNSVSVAGPSSVETYLSVVYRQMDLECCDQICGSEEGDCDEDVLFCWCSRIKPRQDCLQISFLGGQERCTAAMES